MVNAGQRAQRREDSLFQFDRLDFVNIAPCPGLAGLDGPNQRVRAPVEMLRGMLVF